MSGDRKHSRNRDFCKQYAKVGKRESNKMKKLIRHIRIHGYDDVARTAAKNLGQFGFHLPNDLR